MSFIPYPPSVYNLDYDCVKELSNRIYILLKLLLNAYIYRFCFSKFFVLFLKRLSLNILYFLINLLYVG